MSRTSMEPCSSDLRIDRDALRVVASFLDVHDRASLCVVSRKANLGPTGARYRQIRAAWRRERVVQAQMLRDVNYRQRMYRVAIDYASERVVLIRVVWPGPVRWGKSW